MNKQIKNYNNEVINSDIKRKFTRYNNTTI